MSSIPQDPTRPLLDTARLMRQGTQPEMPNLSVFEAGRAALQEELGQDPRPAPRPSAEPQWSVIEAGREALFVERNEQVLESISKAVKFDPNSRAKALQVAADLGIEPGTVERNAQVIRELHRRWEVQRLDLAQRNPALVEWLGNPDFASIAWDQIEQLDGFSKFLSDYVSKDIGTGFKRGQLATEGGMLWRKRAHGTATPEESARLDDLMAQEERLRPVTGIVAGFGEVVGQMTEQAGTIAKGATAGAAAGTAYGLTTGPGALAAVPTFALTGGTAGAITGAFASAQMSEAGNAYRSLIDAGYTHETALQMSEVYGIGAGVLELAGGAAVLRGFRFLTEPVKKAVLKETAAALVKPTLGKVLGRAATDTGIAWTGEIVTEVMQRSLEIALEEAARKLEPAKGDGTLKTSTVSRHEVLADLGRTVKQTFDMVAIAGALGPSITVFRDAGKLRQSQESQQFMADMAKNRANLKPLIDRAPNEAMRYMASGLAGTQFENIVIDGAAWRQVLNQEGLTTEEVQQQIPGLQLEVTQSGTVRISTASYETFLEDSPLDRALKPHIKFDPAGWSMAEAEANKAKMKGLADEAGKLLKESVEKGTTLAESARRVEQRFLSEAKAAGQPDVVAEQNATFYRNFVTLMANEEGVTPEEWDAQKGMRVVGGEMPVREALDQPEQFREGARRTDTPEFREWFGESRVTNLSKDGRKQPRTVYHSTDAKFDQFQFGELGFHFGTKQQAESIGGSRTIRAYLSLRNPLRMRDVGTWSRTKPLFDELRRVADRPNSKLSKDDLDALEAKVEGMRQDRAAIFNPKFSEDPATYDQQQRDITKAQFEVTAPVRDYLQSVGYDGIVYKNEAEGDGDSFIAFNPTQIKSVNNRGTWSPADPNILNQGDAEGSRAQYFPPTREAWLSKKADPSSLAHEMSHFFLHQMTEAALRAEGTGKLSSQRLREDTHALMDWLGIGNATDPLAQRIEEFRSLPPQEFAKAHEQFAYSWEKWLATGKAPAPKLEPIFRRFARWLRNVYTDVVGRLNAIYRAKFGTDLPALTPEVEAIFGRMVASEAAIRGAEQSLDLMPLFQSREQAGMDEAQWADYQEQLDAARERAMAELHQSSLRALNRTDSMRGKMLREMTKAAKVLRAEIKKRVAIEVANRPVYRVLKWLKTGVMHDANGTRLQGDPEPNHYLRADAVEQIALGHDLASIAKHLRKDGTDPDAVASGFGIEGGGRELVRLLLEAQGQDIKAIVERETDAQLWREAPQFASEEDMRDAIDEAVENDVRALFVATELQALEKGMRPVVGMKKAAKIAAEDAIGKAIVGNLKPHDHVVAEGREARLANEASKDGDTAQAIEHKRQQLLQGQMARAAMDAKREVGDALKAAKGYYAADEKLGKRRDIDLIYVVRALMAKHGMGPGATTPQEVQLWDAAWNTVHENYPAMAQQAAPLLAAGKPYKELTVEQFREVAEVADMLWDASLRAKQLVLGESKAALADVVAEFAGNIEALPERTAPGARAAEGTRPTPTQRNVLRLWNWIASRKRFEHWAWFMDGNQLGPWHTYFVSPVQKALESYIATKKRIVGKLHGLMMDLAKESGAAWHSEIRAPELDYTDERGRDVKVTFRGKREFVGSILHTGTQSGLEKLLLGSKWATEFADPETGEKVLDTSKWDAFLDRAYDSGILTEKDVEFVRAVWQTYREMLPVEQQAHKALYGYEFETLEEIPFNARKFGVLNGGYVPARVDRDAMNIPRPGTVVETLDGLEQNFQFSVSTGKGFTIKRNPNFRQPLSLNVAQIINGIDEQIRFAYVQPVVSQLMKLRRDRTFQDALSGYDREAIPTILEPYLSAAAMQASSKPSDSRLWDSVANFLRKSASLAMLGFNFVNAAMQSTGLGNIRANVKGKYIRAAAMKMARTGHAGIREMTEASPAMARRLDQTLTRMQQELARMAEPGTVPGLTKAQDVSGRWAFAPQRYIQAWVDAMTWHAAREQFYAETQVGDGFTEEQREAKAVEFADGVVRRIQGDNNPEGKAAGEITTPVMQLFQQMGSYSATLLNTILSTRGWQAKLSAAVWVVLLPALMEATIRALAEGGEDDDDEDGTAWDEFGIRAMASIGRNLSGLVPVAGPMLWSMAESDGSRVATTPAGSALGEAARGFYALMDSNDGMTGSEARAAVGFLTTLLQLPLAPVGRAAGYALNEAAGKTEASGSWDYLRGLIVGR